MRATTRLLALLCLLCSTPVAPGCDGEGGEDGLTAVTFRAVLGDRLLRCGETYDAVGLAATTIQLEDLRFYVHDVALVDSAGLEVPLALEQDGRWQVGDLALVDLEDRTGACRNGTVELNPSVRGEVPPGDYVGLAFTLGVPVELNHEDAATAPSPLNLSRMFWSWTGGYKFIRLDLNPGQASGWNVHIGSTACSGNPLVGVECQNGNRVRVVLEGFDAARDVVAFDVGRLLDGSDLSATQPPGAGCMSDLGDLDCGPVYQRLGLEPAPGEADPRQSVFRVEAR